MKFNFIDFYKSRAKAEKPAALFEIEYIGGKLDTIFLDYDDIYRNLKRKPRRDPKSIAELKEARAQYQSYESNGEVAA